jgi:proteic killer suppression protein
MADKVNQDVYNGLNSRYARRSPCELHVKARRLLDQINAPPTLDFLPVPSGNRLEKLRGELAGFWSLHVNGRWRITFRWQGTDALDVGITDYQ